MKYLVVEMSDKTRWAIPAILIAQHRAEHYRGESENAYAEEVEYAMSYEYEITDWAANNMDWEDVCSHAIQLKESPPADYHRDWINAPKSIREMGAVGHGG